MKSKQNKIYYYVASNYYHDNNSYIAHVIQFIDYNSRWIRNVFVVKFL